MDSSSCFWLNPYGQSPLRQISTGKQWWRRGCARVSEMLACFFTLNLHLGLFVQPFCIYQECIALEKWALQSTKAPLPHNKESVHRFLFSGEKDFFNCGRVWPHISVLLNLTYKAKVALYLCRAALLQGKVWGDHNSVVIHILQHLLLTLTAWSLVTTCRHILLLQ